MNESNNGGIAIVAIIVIVLVSCFVFYGKVIYRKEMGVVIDDRFWTWYKDYSYTETHTEWVTKTDRNCDDDGKCTTTTRMEEESHTHTYTRCSNTSSGRELPESPPQMSCTKQYGDSETNNINHRITYHEWEDTKQKEAHIKREWWNDFEGDMKITIDLFGYVVKYEVI
jgi:hypothetical protein